MTTETLKLSEIKVSYLPSQHNRIKINRSKDAYQMLLAFFPEETIQLQEQFVVLYLNRAHRIIGGYPLSVGGLSGTVVDIRLILSVALKSLATGIILCHNHPSGNLKPSDIDIRLTDKIRQAGRLMEIEVLDHIIVSSEGYYSFADEGEL